MAVVLVVSETMFGGTGDARKAWSEHAFFTRQ
jgi:hypothetical protein